MELGTGHVAVVTGAASGIGRALAESFARRGLAVVLADVDHDALETAASHTRDVAGADVLAAPCDVADAADVDRLAAFVWDRLGATTVLCNNAGTVASHRSWRDRDAWERVLGVNLWGVVNGLQSFVPRMLASGQAGHIVNTASAAGVMPFAFIPSYVASKHAVVGLSGTLHEELRDSPIGVSVLCPGPVRTNLTASGPWADAPEALEAGAVADLTIDAVEHDRFWILTHAHYVPWVVDNAAAMATGTAPAMARLRDTPDSA